MFNVSKSGFQWVPGSESEPKKWVPVGSSGFRVGTQKVGSGWFRVRTKIFFCADPWSQHFKIGYFGIDKKFLHFRIAFNQNKVFRQQAKIFYVSILIYV